MIGARDVRNGIDVRLMASEGLGGLARTNIPQLRSGVTCPRNKSVQVGC